MKALSRIVFFFAGGTLYNIMNRKVTEEAVNNIVWHSKEENVWVMSRFVEISGCR